MLSLLYLTQARKQTIFLCIVIAPPSALALSIPLTIINDEDWHECTLRLSTTCDWIKKHEHREREKKCKRLPKIRPLSFRQQKQTCTSDLVLVVIFSLSLSPRFT